MTAPACQLPGPRASVRKPEPIPVAQAANDAVIETRATPASLGTLLVSHILQDGEVVLLILKPSMWFIVLSSLRFVAAVLILLVSIMLLDQQLPGHNKHYIEAAALVVAGRIMWAVLQWMGRLYILTDMRIARIAGVFNVNIFDCPLRRVGHTRIVRSMRERIFRLGTIEIVPADDSSAPAQWQMVARPRRVHERILEAIDRARHGRPPPDVASS